MPFKHDLNNWRVSHMQVFICSLKHLLRSLNPLRSLKPLPRSRVWSLYHNDDTCVVADHFNFSACAAVLCSSNVT